ncbi:MAG: hypothetical protein JWQ27_365 [Ferruginibacter sp.]|nr:hypothetical protein [Ferruginibacter sp.]
MIRIIFSMLLALSLQTTFAQTQAEMNQDAQKAYKRSEAEINTVYQQILKAYSDDQLFIKNLRAAQRLWIQFRDAEMKAKFPARPGNYYGSVFPTCWSNYMKALTDERIAKLKTWLEPVPEGEVCGGSVNRNH